MECEGADWWAPVKRDVNLRVPEKARTFLFDRPTVDFSERILLH
jgi:hypothetical protein